MSASTYPWFKRGLAPGESTPASQVPTASRRRAENPAGYIPHADLSHAVNVALALGMPLLLTGEPGTGKTQLAHTLAAELKCPLHKFETKSTSAARDLFYTYDALTAFKMKEALDPRTFIRYQALGLSILEAFPADHPRVAALLPPGARQDADKLPRRSVVLIDEIDKAPRDFPNDLLNEIDRLTFRVSELMNIGSPGAEPGEEGVPDSLRPIVVLTSNSEKGLPDAFLRRCVYFDIPFPDAAQMGDIIASRLGNGLTTASPLLSDAVDLFYGLRRGRGQTHLTKEPSTAELLNWLQLLVHRGASADTRLRRKAGPSETDLVRETLTTLVKTASDGPLAMAFIDKWRES